MLDEAQKSGGVTSEQMAQMQADKQDLQTQLEISNLKNENMQLREEIRLTKEQFEKDKAEIETNACTIQQRQETEIERLMGHKVDQAKQFRETEQLMASALQQMQHAQRKK